MLGSVPDVSLLSPTCHRATPKTRPRTHQDNLGSLSILRSFSLQICWDLQPARDGGVLARSSQPVPRVVKVPLLA